VNAHAHEPYTRCAGAPIAIRHTAAQLRVGDVDRALLVAASREEDLVDYQNEDSSFMFNFGSGASALVLEAGGAADPDSPETASGSNLDRDDARAGDPDRDDARAGDPDRGDARAGGPDRDNASPQRRARATVRSSAATTDGSFSEDVVMPAGGSKRPPSEETVQRGRHTLDVPDPDGMKERLGEVSAPNFLGVADDALAASGYDRADLDFVALTHMKRSFHDYLTSELRVDEGQYYLDDYGHVQSVDQALAVERGLTDELLHVGDVVLFLAAGTGYTWSATVLDWHDDTAPP
jgi:3-oxoacyl-[acyl-carrier-protein] synthase-3